MAAKVPTIRNAALFMDWPTEFRLTNATAKPAHIAWPQSIRNAMPSAIVIASAVLMDSRVLNERVITMRATGLAATVP